jgi:hypothetical protein
MRLQIWLRARLLRNLQIDEWQRTALWNLANTTH